MSGVFVHGLGAVSPAGWGVPALRAAVKSGVALPVKELARPGWTRPIGVRAVPPAAPRPEFLAHPRLRRASAITRYAVGAALGALGADAAKVSGGALRLGIVLCVMNGCVGYSRRFYDETLREPMTASPLVFPETVFNAPASHLAAILGATGINYTLVGDPGTFGQGLALGADWLERGGVDGCLVIGAEEADWATADAFRLFSRRGVLAEGAGAVYLRREHETGAVEARSERGAPARRESAVGQRAEPELRVPVPGKGASGLRTAVALRGVTEPRLFFDRQSRARAAVEMRREFPGGAPKELLCDGWQDVEKFDAAERAAWSDWPGARLSPKRALGEGLIAAAAWQCVVAADLLGLGLYPAANVSLVGCNHQAIGVRFEASLKKGEA